MLFTLLLYLKVNILICDSIATILSINTFVAYHIILFMYLIKHVKRIFVNPAIEEAAPIVREQLSKSIVVVFSSTLSYLHFLLDLRSIQRMPWEGLCYRWAPNRCLFLFVLLPTL